MEQVSFIASGVVVIYLLLRLWSFILSKAPLSTYVGLLFSAMLAFSTATILAGYVTAIDGQPFFVIAALGFLIPTLIASAIEAFRLYRNRSKVA